MPDASTMDPVAVMQRVNEIERDHESLLRRSWAASPSVAAHLIVIPWLITQLRTALADTERWRTRLAQVCGEVLVLRGQLEDALADMRRVDWHERETATVGRVLLPGHSEWLWEVCHAKGTHSGPTLRDAYNAAMAATTRET